MHPKVAQLINLEFQRTVHMIHVWYPRTADYGNHWEDAFDPFSIGDNTMIFRRIQDDLFQGIDVDNLDLLLRIQPLPANKVHTVPDEPWVRSRLRKTTTELMRNRQPVHSYLNTRNEPRALYHFPELSTPIAQLYKTTSLPC